MRKWMIAIVAVPLGLAATVYGAGMLLPRDHVVRKEAVIAAPQPAVAALIRDVANQPRWRPAVERIELRGREGDVLRYVEHGAEGPIAFAFKETAPDGAFESRIDDPDLPFSGSWRIALAPVAAGTRVTIEERGSVDDPLFRFFGTLVFGHEGTIDSYLGDLGRAATGG